MYELLICGSNIAKHKLTMTHDEDILRYDRLVETALRGVVKSSIEEVIEYHGDQGAMPGEHHFYITFLTDYPGVKIPDYLRERYPGEMTIVLQYQFSDLSVDDELLKVRLSFNNVPEMLEINRNNSTRDYKAYYDDESKHIIEQVYHMDIKLLKYKF